MTKSNPCPCNNCACALTCWWSCDELSAWAEDKSFAQVAGAFIDAYNRAAKAQKRQIPPAETRARRSQKRPPQTCPPAGI